MHDLTSEDIALFETLYQGILEKKGPGKVLLQTYFGDVRDCYGNITALAFDGIGLDFLEGRKTKELVEANGFPQDKVLFAGLVNGKNIWKNHYGKTLKVTLITNWMRHFWKIPFCLLPVRIAETLRYRSV